MDRPLLFFIPTLLILLILGLPFLHVRFNAPDATILPPGVPSRQAYDVLASDVRRGRVRASFSGNQNAAVRPQIRRTWPRCTTTPAASPPIRG